MKTASTMNQVHWQIIFVCWGLLTSAAAPSAFADRFQYKDQDGEMQDVEARLHGSGQGVHALEFSDGRIEVIPQGAVMQRQPGPDPAAMDDDGIIALLTEKFGEDNFRAETEKPYVLGLVLSEPLPKSAEGRARAFLKNAGKFFRNVDGVFQTFARQLRFETHPPRFPLVVLIFETDDTFEEYTKQITGGRGISAGNISGFYSGLTNYLAIRMSECHTFEVPLHEAIHQQVYNRGICQRLAPIPKWFDEGIATGFEGSGQRINIGPAKINPRYARRISNATNVTWQAMASDDKAFGGDILAGEAYVHAWAMHWLLVTEYKLEYMKYVQNLGRKPALQDDDATARAAEFETAFGKSPADLQQEFEQVLTTGIKRQRVSLADKRKPGLSLTQENLGEAEITAITRSQQGGALEVGGRLRNISAIRPMSYHVTIETDAGTYAEWFVPSLDVRKTATLKKQYAGKIMNNAPGGPARTFRVQIRSVIPESEEGARWLRGQLPVPTYRR